MNKEPKALAVAESWSQVVFGMDPSIPSHIITHNWKEGIENNSKPQPLSPTVPRPWSLSLFLSDYRMKLPPNLSGRSVVASSLTTTPGFWSGLQKYCRLSYDGSQDSIPGPLFSLGMSLWQLQLFFLMEKTVIWMEGLSDCGKTFGVGCLSSTSTLPLEWPSSRTASFLFLRGPWECEVGKEGALFLQQPWILLHSFYLGFCLPPDMGRIQGTLDPGCFLFLEGTEPGSSSLTSSHTPLWSLFFWLRISVYPPHWVKHLPAHS